MSRAQKSDLMRITRGVENAIGRGQHRPARFRSWSLIAGATAGFGGVLETREQAMMRSYWFVVGAVLCACSAFEGGPPLPPAFESGGAQASAGTASGGQTSSDGGTSAHGGSREPATGGTSSAAGGSGAASAGGASGTTGGSGACTPNYGCQPTAPSTGDQYADCVARLNQFRACVCLGPLARNTAAEACANQQAQYDSQTGTAHSGFSDGICSPNGTAQNECPGWRSAAQTISQCIQSMFDEGPPPTTSCTESCFQTYGHFINMTNTRYTSVACGFYTTSAGEVWQVQNYFR